MALPYEFMQELYLRNNIADIVSNYVTLKSKGGKLFGLCPFHNEKTPSFNVVDQDGYFYCFGCGQGGDVVSFIMKVENLDFIDAIRYLAQRSNLEMPQDSGMSSDLSELRKTLYKINRETAKFYYKSLYTSEGAEALKYLRERQLHESTIKHFGLGYSPSTKYALVDHLKNLGFKESDMVQANVAIQSKYNNTYIDRFVNRVMFPIIDTRGNVIAFGGRILGDGVPKYLNTSDTLLFKKSINLFALNFAKNKKEDNLILAEGYMDVIALHQAGFQNSVATLGTALTAQQATLIKRYTNKVTICYDSDEAGKKATSRASEILRVTDLQVKVLTLKGAKDPDEFIKMHKENGAYEFKKLIENSNNDIVYKLENLKNNYNLNQYEDKIQYSNEATKIIASIDNKIEVDIYTSKLSEEIGVEKAVLMSHINQHRKSININKQKKVLAKVKQDNFGVRDKINPEKQNKLRSAKAEESIIAFILKYPEYAKTAIELLPPENFLTKFNKTVYNVIAQKTQKDEIVKLSDFRNILSDAEISYVAKISASYDFKDNSVELLKEYISIIKEENFKNKIRDNVSDEELMEYMRVLKERKK